MTHSQCVSVLSCAHTRRHGQSVTQVDWRRMASCEGGHVAHHLGMQRSFCQLSYQSSNARERRLSAVYLQHTIGHIISRHSSKAELIHWYHLPKPSASLTRCVVPSAGSCRLVVHCGTGLLIGWRKIDSLGGQDHPSVRRSEARDLEGYVQRRGERTPVRVDSSAYVGSLSIFIIIYQSMWPIVLVEIYLLPYCCKRKNDITVEYDDYSVVVLIIECWCC